MAQKAKKKYVAIVGEIEEVKSIQALDDLQPLVDVEEFEETGELEDGTPCIVDSYGNKAIVILEIKGDKIVPVKLDLEKKFHLVRGD